MTVTPLAPFAPDAPVSPDALASRAASSGAGEFGAALVRALGDASDGLERADAAERAFAAGRGGLQELVLERAQADVALTIASTAASRTAQALTTLLGMQL